MALRALRGIRVALLPRAFFTSMGVFAAGAGYFSQDFDVFAIWIDTVPAWVSKA